MVTYKWLARQYGISANLAKQVLFAFFEAHRDAVAAMYLLAGWTKGTDPPQHVVSLVNSAQLPKKRAALEPVTSLHVYSLQPSQPKVRLWTQSKTNLQCGPGLRSRPAVHESQSVEPAGAPPLPLGHGGALEHRQRPDLRAIRRAGAWQRAQLPGRQPLQPHTVR